MNTYNTLHQAIKDLGNIQDISSNTMRNEALAGVIGELTACLQHLDQTVIYQRDAYRIVSNFIKTEKGWRERVRWSDDTIRREKLAEADRALEALAQLTPPEYSEIKQGALFRF